MSTWIWIGLGVLAVCLLGSKGKPSGGKISGKPTRINHPHYISNDEYECSVCGARFNRALAVCPRCGARFIGSRTDDDEYDEELEEELEMDEWDEKN